MKGFIKFAVEKSVTIFMVVLAVIIFGVVSFTRLTTDLFPDLNIPYAVVMTTYPGASPEEVEQEVSIPLERTFQTTSNIQEVQTTSNENFSIVILEFSQNTDMDTATIEMREQLNNMLDQLPDDASNPSILLLNPDMLPIMTFSVSHDGKDIEALTAWVEDELSPQLERVNGVAQVNISGGYQSEIQVRLDQESIDEINDQIESIGAMDPDFDADEFTFDKSLISSLLEAQNFAYPAGFVRVEGSDYMVRVGDSFASLDEIRELKLFSAGPMDITLEEVADVSFVDADEQSYSKVNGENAVTVTIQKGSEFATTDVTDALNIVLDEVKEDEDGFSYTMLLDQGEFINIATGSVIDNLLLGGILAIVVLFLFLRNVRTTLIIGVAIPVSLMFAIILIYISGITLNVVSLGGLALGIGMLVDNSIVVIENIYRMKKEGRTTKEAAIRGTHQVAGAITASTLTTIGVFLPIMFIEDFIREIFMQLALTITFSLLASLVIAVSFVPTIANQILRDDGKGIRKDKVTNKTPLFEKVQNLYTVVFEFFFKIKTVVLVVVLLLFGGVMMLAVSRGFEFFPETDEGSLQATLEFSTDEPIDFDELGETLDNLGNDLLAFNDVETVGITFGDSAGMMMPMMTGFGGGSDSVSLNIVLRSDRELSTIENADEIEAFIESSYPQFIADISGTEGDTDAIIGSGIQVRVSGDSLDTLREEAQRMATVLEGIEGVREVDSGLGDETEEIRITVDKDEAIAVGLTNAQVLGAVSEYLSEPSVVTNVRIEGRNYELYVYDEDETSRRALTEIDDLRSLVIATDMEDNPVMLDDIASVEYAAGFSSITRINGVRTLTVDASLETDANATLVAQDVEAALDDFEIASGYDYSMLGENEEIQAAIETMLLVGALGIMLVYMIMASQFQSLTYPFIIMITIPLAFTGGFGALYLAGDPVSIVALIGLIILSGVVVNNGIVLVDYINQMRERGRDLKDAILEAGQIRLRPIFMTALTTILALTGMAFAGGEGSELVQPIAFTAIGGLIYATFLTIFVVPIMYYAMTVYGRYVIGFFISLILIAAGYYFFVETLYLYSGILAALLVLLILGVIFIPKSQRETTSGPSNSTDDFINKVIESDE